MTNTPDQPSVGTSHIEQTTIRRRTIGSVDKPTASTSKAARTAASRRKLTQTTSLDSLTSEFGPATVGPATQLVTITNCNQGFDKPPAFNFFDPSTDLQRREPQAPSPSLGIRPERATNIGMESLSHHRSDSVFRRGSFLQIPARDTLHSSFHFQTPVGMTNAHEPPFSSAVGEHGRPSGVREDIRGSRHLTPQDIARELNTRQDSCDDLEAQKGARSQISLYYLKLNSR